MFIKPEDVEWKKVKILKKSDEGPLPHEYEYEFWLPEPLASWDVFDYWERERFHSMEDNLRRGETLFDIGTEQGWTNLIYAQFVGPENMVLIEPTKEFWPNIRETWERNLIGKPIDTIPYLLSDKDSSHLSQTNYINGWIDLSYGDLIDRNKYQYIHDNPDGVTEMKIDTYVKTTGVSPQAMTMDTEGSELLILKGAEETLKTFKPKLWVSIHPDLGLRDYGIKSDDTIKYLEDLGYTGEHLSTDHEEHWYFKHESSN